MSETFKPVSADSYLRQATTVLDDKGEAVVHWTLTPKSQTDTVQIIAAPVYTLPVIFVPGVMGSNLMLTADVTGMDKGDAVWLMDSPLGAASAWVKRKPNIRQLRLNPETTEVYPGGDVPPGFGGLRTAEDIRKHRFWGEVGAMSYIPFLQWLKSSLNGIGRYTNWQVYRDHDFGKQWGALHAFEALGQATTGSSPTRIPPPAWRNG